MLCKVGYMYVSDIYSGFGYDVDKYRNFLRELKKDDVIMACMPSNLFCSCGREIPPFLSTNKKVTNMNTVYFTPEFLTNNIQNLDYIHSNKLTKGGLKADLKRLSKLSNSKIDSIISNLSYAIRANKIDNILELI